MGNLNNLYISQSYQSLLHFATDSGSTATLTEIEDGSGNGLGFYLNNAGSASFDGDVTIGGDLVISGAIDIEGAIVIRDNVYVTGSIYSSQDISSSRVLAGEITASNLRVEGTLTAYEIHTVIESSSVIFSSGSNILGDSILDTQTLNGTIIVSGSEQVTGSLSVSNEISSSTINGIGNVTAYSQSVQNKFNSVNAATASLYTSASLGLTTASVNVNVLTFRKGDGTTFDLTVAPISFNSGSYLLTASFNDYTQSYSASQAAINDAQNVSLTNLNIATASLNTTTASLNTSVSNLNTFSASTLTRLNVIETTYATTGSNTFRGTESIEGGLNLTGSLGVSGSMVYSGSVRGQVFPITISANTASMDCSKGNFFTLSVPVGTTRLEATNIQPGETLSLRVTNETSQSILTYNSGSSASIKFPNGFQYVSTAVSGTTDIITFLTFDTTSIYAVGANYFV